MATFILIILFLLFSAYMLFIPKLEITKKDGKIMVYLWYVFRGHAWTVVKLR